MSPPHSLPSPQALAFAAGHGSLARDAERYADQTQQRVVNARPNGTSPPPAPDGPPLDLDALGPADLAYLAGRGRVALNAEEAQDDAAERIVNATRGGHIDPFGEITGYAWQDGDRIVFDQHGGHEYIPGDEEQ